MPTQHTLNQLGFYFVFMLLSFYQPVIASDCDHATDLLFHAYYLYSQGRAVSQQKLLFNKSLRLCSDMPDVHSTLASILEKQGKDAKALYHYGEAVRYDKKYSMAWYGLGEIYYKQKRFPLSLEAHLRACKTDKGSKARAMELLETKRYAFTEEGDIIDQEDLLVLYDGPRRRNLNKMLTECELGDVRVQPVHTFFNLIFPSGEATLPPEAERQFEEIADALLKTNSLVKIHGYADNQPYLYRSQAMSEKLNLGLSQERAATVATALAEWGVSMERMEALGHGDKKLLVPDESLTDYAKNRRVEIEVQEIAEW
jgi:outer membrane protein OmpA-like peptidoglycan-associated protein